MNEKESERKEMIEAADAVGQIQNILIGCDAINNLLICNVLKILIQKDS